MTEEESRFSGEVILIVDDEEVIIELAAALLQRIGFKVLAAKNGEECLQMVAEHQPSLVLLDYMMPVMNGLDALKAIRSQFPDTYVVMFTGHGNEDVAVELMRAGAADYLRKPFAGGSLLKRIDAVLSLRHIEMENKQLVKERESLQREIEQWNLKLEQRVREKSYELEKAHKEIIQSEKLAALGHISAGMVHEIRNPLNSINLFAQVLLSSGNINQENMSYIHKISQEVERIDGILIQMLAASPVDKNKLEGVDLGKVIEKVYKDYLPRMNKQNVDFVFDIDGKIPLIKSDPSELEKIFTNLFSNALYEMEAGGTLTISLAADAEKISIMIKDSGSGVLPEDVSRIFDPFFTTKEKGTGFGLSVVLQIIKSYCGKIRLNSAPDEGASFLIELPLFPDSVH